jgi:hypothetical protein
MTTPGTATMYAAPSSSIATNEREHVPGERVADEHRVVSGYLAACRLTGESC